MSQLIHTAVPRRFRPDAARSCWNTQAHGCWCSSEWCQPCWRMMDGKKLGPGATVETCQRRVQIVVKWRPENGCSELLWAPASAHTSAVGCLLGQLGLSRSSGFTYLNTSLTSCRPCLGFNLLCRNVRKKNLLCPLPTTEAYLPRCEQYQ